MMSTICTVALFLLVAGVRVWRLDGERRSARASLIRMFLSVVSCVVIWMLMGSGFGLPEDSGVALGVVLLGVAALPSMLAAKARAAHQA